MENHNFNGYKFNKRAVINKGKSQNIFAKLSYRRLQEAARELNLPVLLKHKVLLALVIAKTEGRSDIVNVILKPKSQKDEIKLTSYQSRSREKKIEHSISVPNEETSILKNGNAHFNHVTIASDQSLANVPVDSVNQITESNHVDSDSILNSVQHSSSSSDEAYFSSAPTDSADAATFDAFLALNESTFAQENEADMSLFLPEPSFGSENYASCDLRLGSSEDINIYNESNLLDDGLNDLASILLRY